ncbi:MAG: hypothetical protein HN348_02705, partial [Proteobacteria bacterium]|nr:hypothetical protein [Pseudomonadota bacterium]
MAKAFILKLHADESGVFHQMDRREPFVIALVYRDHGRVGRDTAEEWWEELDLRHYSRFHATEVRDKSRLRRGVAKILDHFADHDTMGVKVVHFTNRPGRALPRRDMHLDLVLHAVVLATRDRVREMVHAAKGSLRNKDSLRPLVVRLNLAKRNRINGLYLEKVVEKAVRADLARFDLVRPPEADGPGIQVTQIRCEVAILDAHSSVFLTISDLLCNHWYRALKRGKVPTGWPVASAWEVPPAQLGTLMTDTDYEALGMATSGQATDGHVSPQTQLELLLGDDEGPWNQMTLATAGIDGSKLSARERMGLISMIIESGEECVDVRCRYDKAAHHAELVDTLLSDPSWSAHLDEEDFDVASLGVDTLRATVANHLGQPGGDWLREQGILVRSQRLIADPAHWEAVARFHNRVAVGLLYGFYFGDAARQLEKILGWYRAAQAGMIGPFRGRRATEADSKHRFPVLESRPTESGGPGVNHEFRGRRATEAGGPGVDNGLGVCTEPNWTIGALAGTLGQALALLASTDGAPHLLNKADEAFLSAMGHFVTGVDLDRQKNYRSHLALERIRMGIASSNDPVYSALFAEYEA